MNKRGYLLALLTYVGLSILITWPVIAKLTTEYAGGRSDLWVHQWSYWWVKYALLNGKSPLYTTLLYYPKGITLVWHTIAWPNVAVWLVLQTFLGEMTAYNVVFITGFSLNGFAMFLFAREHLSNSLSAFITGIVFAFWPYTLSHFDHPNLFMVFWIPLSLFFLRRTIRQQTRGTAVLSGLSIALLGLTSWQLLAMSLPLYGIYLFYLLRIRSQNRPKYLAGLLLLTAVTTIVALAPILIPAAVQTGRASLNQVAFQEPDRGRTDLLAFILTPNGYDSLLGNTVANPYYQRPYEQIAASAHYIPFLGYLTLLLALIGTITQWKQARLWLLIALVYFALALGPELVVNGRVLVTHLPYQLIENSLPGILIRRPHRLNLLLGLPVAMLVGWGMVTLLNTAVLRRRQTGIIFTSFITLFLLLEHRLPVPLTTTPYAVPAFYQQLAHDPDEYGVLDLPLNDRRFDKWYMSYQTTHQKPLAVGHSSRLPRGAFSFLQNIPFMASFIAHDNELDSGISDISQNLKMLAEGNIRYIVIHKQFVHEGYRQQWRDWFTIEPVYEDDEVIVYNTSPQFGVDFTFSQKLTDALGLIRTSYAPVEAVQNGVVKVDVRWGATAVPIAESQVCFDWLDDTAVSRYTLCQPISIAWPAANWQADEVVKESYILPIPKAVPPGSYTLAMQVADENDQRLGNQVELGPVQLSAYAPQSSSTAVWGEAIHLPGYTISQSDDMLHIDLYWQTNKPLDRSYVAFIHLIDADTGQIAAQNDAIPRDWTYPTFAWEPEEIIKDTRQLPLNEISPGLYQVWVGLYDQETGERVLAANENGKTADTIYLTDIQK